MQCALAISYQKPRPAETHHTSVRNVSKILPRSLLKCRLDAPALENIVQITSLPGRVPQFVAQPLCVKIRLQYMAVYGAESKGVKQEMPRRCLPRESQPGEKTLKRKRQEHLDAAECDLAGEDLERLEAIAETCAKSRQSKKQLEMANALQKHAAAMKRQYEADLLPVGTGPNAGKLAQHKKEAAEVAERIRNVQRASLAVAMSWQPLSRNTLIIADSAGDALALDRLGVRVVPWPQDTAEQIDVCKEALSAASLVWLTQSVDAERSFLFEPGYSTFAGCARFIGGYVAGPQWLALAQQHSALVHPLLV